jgi:hydrogenase large subunit
MTEIRSFIHNVYEGDLELVASTYPDYFEIGSGCGNLLSFGVFDTSPSGDLLFPSGIMTDGVIGGINPDNILEYNRYSWYSSQSGENPADGTTAPSYGKSGAYSWLKSPRYNNNVYEVGPLARVWMSGDHRGGISVMDRHLARYVESVKLSDTMLSWIDDLVPGADSYTAVNPTSGQGIGLTEAPRGALGHWITISNSAISNYQIITPTCWNASPMDDNGNPGPIEQALIGTHIADVNQPIEVLRIIHSFDPCTACSVHVMNPKGMEMSNFVVQPGI